MGSERFHRDPNLAWQELNGEILILATEQGKVHELNEVAASMWKVMETPQSKEDLLQHVMDEFEVAIEEVRADIDDVLTEWQALDLIQRVA